MKSFLIKLYDGLKHLVSAALILAAILLLFFGPRAGEEIPKDRTVIIDYWEKWGGEEEAAMRKIVDDFNNTVGQEKHIYVRYLSTSDVEKKTLVATAAGVPPDVAGLYNQDIPQFASMSSLEPLDALAAEHHVTADQYKKVFWDEGHYDGHLYGLVSSGFSIGLFYNKDLFAESADKLRARGLDPNRAPRTIAELDQYADAINRFDSSGRITLAGFLPQEPGWYSNYDCIWFGGSWWDDHTHKFTFTSPAVVKTYEWYSGYSARLGKDKMGEFQSGVGAFDSPMNSFLAPIVAMVQQGAFFARFIHHLDPAMDGHWAAAPFPSADPNLKDVTYCNCDVLCIPRGSKHKEEAFEFIAFVDRQNEMEKLAWLHGKISPLSKVSPEFMQHNINPYIAVFDRLAASPNAHATEPIPILQQVQDEMNNFTQALALQQVTPEEGLRQMQLRLQKKYDDFMEDQRERKLLAQR
jgi:multiple sugar transport system substrate-binding protein